LPLLLPSVSYEKQPHDETARSYRCTVFVSKTEQRKARFA